MKAICITVELDHYDKGETYEVDRIDKPSGDVWIKDNLLGSDCWGVEIFLRYFKYV